jgi:predicted solute-binding protein
LSEGSRSTNLLCRLVLHWQRPGQTVAFHTRPEDALRSLHEFDGCLLIGDQALTDCCQARFRYDLGALWLERMKVPLVLSVWLARPGADAALGRLIKEAAGRGMAQLDTIAEKAATKLHIDSGQARAYLTSTLDYHWSGSHASALGVFAKELAAAGLIKPKADITYTTTPVSG